MNPPRILFVDDDPKILRAIERRFEDQFDLHLADGPNEGLDVVKNHGPFAVVVSDMQMPGMTGIEMLTRIKNQSPDTVRIMLTGFAELQSTIEAVNEGNVFRFLSKPCSNEVLQLAIEDGIRQHNLIQAEKELVEGTLIGCVTVLSDVLGLVNPVAFGRGARVKRTALVIAEQLKVENAWELEIAAMLSALGCVTLSQSILQKLSENSPLSPEDQEAFEGHPKLGQSLLSKIPRMETVSEIIAYQEKHFDGGGVPQEGLSGHSIPLGARILKVALDFDTQENICESFVYAINAMKRESGKYDPDVLQALEAGMSDSADAETVEIQFQDLELGMIFAKNVLSGSGQVLVAKGNETTNSVMNFLQNYAQRENLSLPLSIYAKDKNLNELIHSSPGAEV